MSPAERAGLSPARLANIERLLREKYLDTGRFPGTLTQIWRRGELAYSSALGFMDVARNKPVRADAIYRIRSMSKPITTVAIMMLVEEGRTGLADDVATYIPAWEDLAVFAGGTRGAFRTVPPKRPMKIIDLMTHTSGLTYASVVGTPVAQAYADAGVGRQASAGLAEMTEQLAAIPLEFSPGEAWNYGVSMEVLGYIVEQVSGERFGDFLERRLFKPLGMVDTGFFCPPGKVDRLAACYDHGPRLTLADDPPASEHLQPPQLESGGGGLLSTAADYLRFCRMMLGGGTLDGAQILSPKTVALYSLNFLPDNREMLAMAPGGDATFNEAGFSGVGFSLGCAVTMDLTRTRLPGTVGEFFWGGSATTAFWIDPREDMAAVFMTQVNNSPWRIPVRRDLRTLVYSAFTEFFCLMHIDISGVISDFPDFRVAAVVARGLTIPAERPPELAALIAEREAACRARWGGTDLSAIPGIAVWRAAYRAFGIKKTSYRCSVERLVKNVLVGRTLPPINAFVDACNAISLTHVMPLGADDLAHVVGDVAFRRSRADDTFLDMAGGEEGEGGPVEDPPKQGEVVYADAEKVLCRRWNWRQDARSLVSPATTDAIVTVQMNGEGDLDAAVADLEGLIRRFCGGSVVVATTDGARPVAEIGHS